MPDLVTLLMLAAGLLTLVVALKKCEAWVPLFILVVALLIERWHP